ncbi:tape measure protein [Limosilactobacillus balticus]|uniref:Tape measure protein n=1 Tax=Limosilactobacillus balticus TaxID=2759747 RepID=A0ABS8RDI7_9LACO|nr:tape measure protein [Limosilactobacillus balticus]MCD7138798.1 tape measure protein [Limosilactobacillus balticus]
MSEVLVNKIVRISGEDRLTSVIARTNQAMESLQQKMAQLGLKFNSSATDTASFRTSLDQVKANASQTDESLNKLNNTIDKLKGDKKVKVEADTLQADSNIHRTQNEINHLPSRHDIKIQGAGTSQVLSGLNELKNKASQTFSSMRRDMQETGTSAHRLRDIIAGTVVGQAVYNGVGSALSTVKNGLVGAVEAGFKYNAEMEKMNATWTTLTGSAGKADKMTQSIVHLSNTLGQSVDVTDELAQQFYHVFDNQPETEKLTKSFLTMGDAIGLSGDRLTQVGMDFTHMLSASTLHLGELNQITDAFPMFGEALLKYERKVQHSSSLTMNELRKQISAGKISAKDAEAVMNELGNKYKKASDNLMGTLPGMLRQIKAQGQGLLGAMVDPLNKAVNPIMKQVSKWVADDHTKKEFSKLGDAANTGVAAVMQAFANAFGNGSITQMLDNMINGLTSAVTKFSNWLARNGTSIVKIFASIGSIAKSVGTGFIYALSDFLHLIPGVHSSGMKGIADAFSEIAKHKTALQIVGRIWATYFVASKIMSTAKAMNELYKNMLAIATLSKIKSPTGTLFGDLGYLNGGRVRKAADKSATSRLARYGNIEKQGVQIAPYLDENGFKGAWSKFTRTLPILGSSAGKQTGEAVSKGLLTRFTGGLTGLESLGKGIAGKLGAGISIGLSAIDLARGLTPSFKGDRWKEVGKGAGGLIGAGIGGFFGGPMGATIGGSIGNIVGGWLGKAAHKGFNFMRDVFHGRITFSGIEHGFSQTMSKVGKWAQDTWKKIKAWWNQDPTEEGRSKAEKSANKKPTEHEIKSLGGNHYSKADIANIKEMNKAVEAYTKTLRNLKSTIKKNDPTKELNSMNKVLKQSAKYWLALSKPLKQISKAFQDMKKPLDNISKSMKDLTGKKSGLGAFDKDLTKLEKDLQHSKIGQEFTKLSKEIKKSDLVKTLQKLTKEIKDSVKYWKEFAKPVKQTTSEFQKFSKELKPFNGKNNPLDRLEKSIESLTKSLKKNRFGNEFAKQMQIANKSMSGRGSVESKFSSMTRTLERDLSRFKSAFNRDWRDVWDDLSSYPSRALSRVVSTVSSRFNSIENRERSFTSKFLSGWRSWNNSVVSEMRSAFDKLPDIARKAMSGIVSRLNSGISAINSVIGDFGGDKRLSPIHYAQGTFAHPGGKAIVNDGLQANKTELIWQPSQGWGTAQGQNVVRDLEAGSMVLDADRSQPYLNYGLFPHYANGTLSEAEQDKISQEFIANPVQASKNLVLKLTNWNSSVPAIADLGQAMAVGFSRGIANVLKDLLGIIKEPVHGDWTPVIKSAARLMHVSLSEGQIGKLLRQIQTESGGNEKISQQISDVNSAAGHPAQGLLQFIPSTFNTWAMPGHHNLLSGFDQIMAAINALNHGGEGGWGNIGNGHGWASGVHMTHRDYALIGDNAENDEYVINPYNGNAMPLIQDAYQTMMNHHPEWRTPTSSAFNSQVIELIKTAITKLDNIDMHPHVTVEDVARPVNKYNAKNYSLRS